MAKKKKHIPADYSITFLHPSVIFGYKGDDEDSRTFGFKLSDISFGITYEKYDYGHIFEVSFFGFGISAWWIY